MEIVNLGPIVHF